MELAFSIYLSLSTTLLFYLYVCYFWTMPSIDLILAHSIHFIHPGQKPEIISASESRHSFSSLSILLRIPIDQFGILAKYDVG